VRARVTVTHYSTSLGFGLRSCGRGSRPGRRQGRRSGHPTFPRFRVGEAHPVAGAAEDSPPLGELQDVVGEADEAPLGGDLLDAAQQEMMEAARLIDSGTPALRRSTPAPFLRLAIPSSFAAGSSAPTGRTERPIGSPSTQGSLIGASAASSISYSLWSSSNNRVTWNTGDYPFTANLVLANGSSYNTVYNNSFGTADFVGVLVADPLQLPQPSIFGSSSNNTITYNTIHSSGPTGHEIHSGVVPDFLGGIVILNSASNNEVEYNQLWQNTGNDLK
jgi:Right handed beta helix region